MKLPNSNIYRLGYYTHYFKSQKLVHCFQRWSMKFTSGHTLYHGPSSTSGWKATQTHCTRSEWVAEFGEADISLLFWVAKRRLGAPSRTNKGVYTWKNKTHQIWIFVRRECVNISSNAALFLFAPSLLRGSRAVVMKRSSSIRWSICFLLFAFQRRRHSWF